MNKEWKVGFDTSSGQTPEDLESHDEKFELTWIVSLLRAHVRVGKSAANCATSLDKYMALNMFHLW